MAIPLRLEVGHDVEALVRRLGEVEQEPLPGLVHVGEGAVPVDRLELVAVREETHGGPLLPGPEPSDAGIFRMQHLDRRRDAVDRNAEPVEPLGEAGQNLSGIVGAGRLTEQPVVERGDLGGESRIEICRGSVAQ